ncbi:MAG TPA: non-canonical purine NTP pyrophosphatase [Candidatus Paceibacterota bacterium]
MTPYDPKKIEEKWNKKWLEEKVFKATDDSKKPKYYQLETFPYPSAAGLHMGHPKGYTAEDIRARYMRMHGNEVLYTMGWDAFGLPTENYAIKVGRNPKDVARENTDNFRRQVQMFGFSYDWDREIDTSSPEYYKWTQWLFIQFFKKGLAYRKEAKVNWCPKDQTVLANEQVIDGKCERCGTEIEERMMEQWFLKITDYAERLLADLKGLDWPAPTIKRQEDWIGKSEGAELSFTLNWPAPKMDLVFATNNQGKFKRMQKLFAEAGLSITLKMPADIGIKDFDVVEDGKTLAENTEKKARALAKLTDLPVFADDTGFFIDGTEINPVTVKRNALGGVDEKSLTMEQIAEKMQVYYKSVATARGGRVDAEWHQALCFITPERAAVHEEAVRPVVLTDEMHGTFDPSLPLRGLYIPKATGKYPSEETEEEELLELKPLTDAIKKLFTPAIKIFTTRPDTLFGATYLVLAPEHPFVNGCIKQKAIANIDEVAAYVEASSHKTDRMRQEEVKDKTGVELKGVKAINPATKEEIPIWVADYVLGSYGTGAIMAVPAHDERDFEFAKKFGLPIKQVVLKPNAPIKSYLMGGEKITDQDLKNLDIRIVEVIPSGDRKIIIPENKITDYEKLITEKIDVGFWNEYIGKETVFIFKHSDNRTERIVLSNETEAHINDLASQFAKQKFISPWLMLAENKWYEDIIIHLEYGALINSGQFSDMDSEKAKAEITKFVGGKMKTQYKIRDWSVSRQRYWGVPIPMIHCPKDGIVPVPENELPVVLPDLENYRPQGMPPLASSPAFINVKCPQCGGDAKRDPETLDTFVDSSWYFLRYPDPHNATAIFDKAKVAHWMPVDLYVIGAEHTVMHLLYSRFVTKFLHDEGYFSFIEPFKKMRHIGLIMGADGTKMSKSKGNVVNPDEIVAEFSADAMRMYLMFLGPFYDATPWDAKGILGIERFLKRFWNYCNGVLEQAATVSTPANTTQKPSATNALHRTIKKVGDDIEAFKFNTAISALMILLNELEPSAPLAKDELVSLVKLIHPFAPHMCQELWSLMGNASYLDFEPWPAYDPALIAQEKITIVFQVNGKTKDTVSVDAAIDEGAAKEMALASEKVKAALATAGVSTPKRVIYVDKKLVNIVI